MKFGNQVLNKSVPEWKLHNIDYEKLKKAIKKATIAHTDEQNEKNLNRCTELFKEQFEAINLFVSLKFKEITSRLITIERSIITLKKKEATAGNLKLQLRQLRVISTHVDGCSSELQRLSRYLIIQKIALRKLLKKFVKHYPYSKQKAQKYVQDIKQSSELNDGYEGVSFVNVDLDPCLLEISLIVNILNDFQNSLSGAEQQYNCKNDKTAASSVNMNNNIESSLSFDISFLGKYQKVQSFLISSQNVEEFKFMVLNLGFRMLDDEIISTSKDIQDTAENISSMDSKSIRSVRSFMGLQQMISHQQLQQQPQRKGSEPINTPTSVGSTSKNLVASHIPASPIQATQSRLSEIILDTSATPAFTQDESINQHPSIILISEDDQRHCVLMCHVGGLRDHFETSNISYDDLKRCISGEEVDFRSVSQHFTPIDKLAIEWLQSRHLRPLDPKIYFKRTRFICSSKDITYLIALDEEISIGNASTLKHAIFEIKKLSHTHGTNNNGNPNVKSKNKIEKLSQLCDALIEQKFECYPLSSHNTVWQICFELQHSNNLQADLFATLLKDKYEMTEGDSLSVEEFFLLGRDDVLSMCSSDLRERLQRETESNAIKTIQMKHKEKVAPNTESRIRYWNEFDDDPDFLSGSNGFYIDEAGEQQGGSADKSDYGLIRFNRKFINSTFRTCQKIRIWLGLESPISPHIAPMGSHYGSISEASVSTLSHEDLQAYIQSQDQEMDDDDSVYEYRHDQVVTFMYLSSLLTSCVTSGISLGIVLALFNRQDTDAELEVAEMLAMLICVTLVLSLLLICSSLLLLFSRFKIAPTWHYISCFLLFLVVIFTVCYGLIEILF